MKRWGWLFAFLLVISACAPGQTATPTTPPTPPPTRTLGATLTPALSATPVFVLACGRSILSIEAEPGSADEYFAYLSLSDNETGQQLEEQGGAFIAPGQWVAFGYQMKSPIRVSVCLQGAGDGKTVFVETTDLSGAGSWLLPELDPGTYVLGFIIQEQVLVKTLFIEVAQPTETPSPSPGPSATQTGTPTRVPTSAFRQDVPMRFVPRGSFLMGSDNAMSSIPVHTVYLDAFFIDKYEVTNVFYRACVIEHICEPARQNGSSTRPSYYDSTEFNDFPVVYVDWTMAEAYCEWRGGRLPTEAEWEKTARGTDGRTYPWGEGIDCTRANYDKNISSGGQVGCPVDTPASLGKFSSHDLRRMLGVTVGDTTRVGSYESGQSPYGAYDMIGNVTEWVADWYSQTYYQNPATENPTGPESGQYRVLRGGWFGSFEGELQAGGRGMYEPSEANDSMGFRCARETSP
jgi:formylglycine-generating enzyme required for sulfatase activity